MSTLNALMGVQMFMILMHPVVDLIVSPPSSYVEILTPKGDGIRRWGLQELFKS